MNIQLALQVRRSVLREPDLFNMDAFFDQVDEWKKEKNPKSYGELRCGTVACIAGHVLACNGRLSLDQARKNSYELGVKGEAAKDLDIDREAASDMFYPWGKEGYRDIIKAAGVHPVGSPEYAAEAVKLIDHCVRLNATEIEQAAYFAQIGG